MNSFFISRKSNHAVRWQTSRRVEKRLAKTATDEAPSVGREFFEDEMKKSIGDNMIPKGWSFEQGLELVKKSGFDGIELWRSEEHTSELQSRLHLVCRLLLEKKKKKSKRDRAAVEREGM